MPKGIGRPSPSTKRKKLKQIKRAEKIIRGRKDPNIAKARKHLAEESDRSTRLRGEIAEVERQTIAPAISKARKRGILVGTPGDPYLTLRMAKPVRSAALSPTGSDSGHGGLIGRSPFGYRLHHTGKERSQSY